MTSLPKYGSMKGAKLSELCERAAAIYEEHPEAWCKGAYTRNELGDPCAPDSADASKFCAEGLIGYLQGQIIGGLTSEQIKISMEAGLENLISLNDFARGVEDVVGHLHKRAAALRELNL